MQGIVCDRCGAGLLIDGDEVRFVLNLEIHAAYDPMEITAEDLSQDFEAEYRRLLQQAESASAEDLERQVHHQGTYDLCMRCRREFFQDPLFRSPPADKPR